MGVGVLLLRFDLLLGVAVGDGLGEAFFRFGEAVGDGVGVGFFVECFRCLRLGVGLGSGSRTFLIFEPSESSAAFATWSVPIEIAKTRSSFRRWHANVKSKAAQHCRTPKRGRHYKLISRSRFGVRRCSAAFHVCQATIEQEQEHKKQ